MSEHPDVMTLKQAERIVMLSVAEALDEAARQAYDHPVVQTVLTAFAAITREATIEHAHQAAVEAEAQSQGAAQQGFKPGDRVVFLGQYPRFLEDQAGIVVEVENCAGDEHGVYFTSVAGVHSVSSRFLKPYPETP